MYDKKLNFYNRANSLRLNCDFHDVAREMFEDPKCEGQKAIMKELKGRGINPDFTDIEKIMNLPET